jgi:ABC-type enterobactin transport system permease subunit
MYGMGRRKVVHWKHGHLMFRGEAREIMVLLLLLLLLLVLYEGEGLLWLALRDHII